MLTLIGQLCRPALGHMGCEQPSFYSEPTRCYGNVHAMLINFSPEPGEDSHASSRLLCQGLSGFNRAWLIWINMRSVYTALRADVMPKCLPCTPPSVLRRHRCGRSGCGQASLHAGKPTTAKPADFASVLLKAMHEVS